MAEDCIRSPVTSETIKTNEENSAGKPRSSNGGRTPHYLRAPGGSCHEHCKYGGTQTFKTKPRNPMRGKTTRKLPDELLLAEDVVVPGSAQEPTIKLEILSNLESQTPDIANVGKQEGPGPNHRGVEAKRKKKSEVELKSSRSSKMHISDLHKMVKPGMASSGTKKVSLGASAMFSSGTYSRSVKTKMEPLGSKPISLPDSSGDSSHRKKSSITASQDTRTSRVVVKNLSVSSTTSNSLEFSARSPSMRPRKGIAGKVMSPLKNRNRNQNNIKNAEDVQIAKEMAVQEKTLYVIKEETEHIPSEFTSTTTPFAVDDQNGSGLKMSPDQSLLLPQHLSLPKCPSPKSHEETSAVDDQNGSAVKMSPNQSSSLPQHVSLPKCPSPKSHEETFAVDDQNGNAVKMSPDQSLLLPQHLSPPKCPSPKSHEEDIHESPDYTDDKEEGWSDSGHDESNCSVQAGTSLRPTQDRTNSEKNETCKAANLSVRNSKVIVGTQAESSSLRRLKIRQGRAFGQNQSPKADARRRTFKRREEIEGGKNTSTPSSIEITLKHQDVREKKEGQRLFNNMIEETASQLAKTRKSKVKALVGAFETVISLQETKDLVK